MTIRFTPPEKPLAVVAAIARSGMKGTTEARKELARRLHARLASEVSNAPR